MSCSQNDKNVAFVQCDAKGDDSSDSDVSGAPNDSNNNKKPQSSNEFQELQENGNPNNGFTLMDFSDEVLYEIFKNLDSWSIIALMNSSERFVNLLLDKRFWYDIDVSQKPLPLGVLEDILVRSNEKTHTIKMCGPPSDQHVAYEFKRFTQALTSIFPKLHTSLQVLELEGVSLDFNFIDIADFPPSLKKLALKDCSVKMSEPSIMFRDLYKHLRNLNELRIEYCDWFISYYLLEISRLPMLRKLSLKGCKPLNDLLRYTNVAIRYGFNKLEVLDVRFTPYYKTDLLCVAGIKSLREFLVDSPLENSKETESSDQSQLLAEESNNNEAGPMKEVPPKRNYRLWQGIVPKNYDLTGGYLRRPFRGRAFDNEPENNGDSGKNGRKLEDTDRSTDSKVQTSKPTLNAVEDKERCSVFDAEWDVGAIKKSGDDDGIDDTFETRGLPDVDGTETRSTVSLTDAARESSPPTSRSNTHSEA